MQDDPHANKSPSQMIEEGVGLIARGMFRKGDRSHENDPQAAYEDGMAAVSVIRETALEFLRKANASAKQ